MMKHHNNDKTILMTINIDSFLSVPRVERFLARNNVYSSQIL